MYGDGKCNFNDGTSKYPFLSKNLKDFGLY